MTKTIKICDKCGKECGWLFTVPYMHIRGLYLEFMDKDPCGKAQNEYCEECTQKIIEKVNDIVLRQNF